MKLLFTAADRYEAEIGAGLLREAGVPALIRSDDQGGLRTAMNFGQGVQIHVAESDMEVAVTLLTKNNIEK